MRWQKWIKKRCPMWREANANLDSKKPCKGLSQDADKREPTGPVNQCEDYNRYGRCDWRVDYWPEYSPECGKMVWAEIVGSNPCRECALKV